MKKGVCKKGDIVIIDSHVFNDIFRFGIDNDRVYRHNLFLVLSIENLDYEFHSVNGDTQPHELLNVLLSTGEKDIVSCGHVVKIVNSK